MITFDTRPDAYKHWKLTFDGPIATLSMDVREDAGLSDDYKLKLNSYDLAVDIELADAIQRLRFEHPEVRAVIVSSLKERIFCAGANIMMLRGSSHCAKVNFCKFTNETRLAIEDASANSGLKFLAALNGVCAGGGYELALAVRRDLPGRRRQLRGQPAGGAAARRAPGTGGLTRVGRQAHVRRDLADFFSTLVEGVKASARRVAAVDAVYPTSQFKEAVQKRAQRAGASLGSPASGPGITLNPLNPTVTDRSLTYSAVTLTFNRDKRTADLTVQAPTGPQPSTPTRS
jgi:benzoyl-CoA-dihydrodiol lyase